MCSELKASSRHTEPKSRPAASNGPVETNTEQLIRQVQDVMWNKVGIVRDGRGLRSSIQELQELTQRNAHPQNRRAYEARNINLAGLLVARSALAREESRGAHYRIDYPDHNDAKFLKHSMARGELVRFE